MNGDRVRGCLRGTAPHRRCADACTSCRPGGPNGGCVERANRSARIEFWSLYDGPLTVAGVAPALARFEFFFNYERPHTSLAYRTPNEYLVALEAA